MTTPTRFRVPGGRTAHITAQEGDRLAHGSTLVWSGGVPSLCGVTVGDDRAMPATPADPVCPACERTAR